MSQSGRYEVVTANDISTLTGDAGGPVGPDATDNVNILGGTGISVTGNPATNTLTINSTGGLTWELVDVNNKTIENNYGYICNHGPVIIVYALPATAEIGDMFYIVGDRTGSSGNWQIQCGAGQNLEVGLDFTSAAGTLSSTNPSDSLQAVCIEKDTRWSVILMQTNFFLLT